jgi:hypothetical protein
LAARVSVTLIGGAIVLMLVAQFARIVHRNIVYAAQLRDVQRDIADLERKRDWQQHEIARLSDPEGAIPEIHDRLHLVGDHEAIIYLKRPDPPSDPQ